MHKSGSEIFCMTLQQKKGSKYDFVFRRFIKSVHPTYQIIWSGHGLEKQKFTFATNKRLLLDSWAFSFSQKVSGHSEPGEVEPHSKVFCHMVSSKKENTKEILAPLMMQIIENVASSS